MFYSMKFLDILDMAELALVLLDFRICALQYTAQFASLLHSNSA